MVKKIDPFIIKKEGSYEYAEINPEYTKKVNQQKYELFLKKSNIPSFYWNIEFDHYEGNKDDKDYKKIIYYAYNCYQEKFDHVHLFLYGTHSTQKTALGINVLKQCIKNGMTVKFILAGVLIDRLMKTQGFKVDEDIYNEIKELKRSDIILIDDAFDPDKSLLWKNSDNKNMILSEWDIFLREVLSSKTRVIITSNFDPSVIKQHYGNSLYELIDRNFICLQLTENIKTLRKSKLSSIFKDIK